MKTKFNKLEYLIIWGMLIAISIMFSYMVKADTVEPTLNSYSNSLNGLTYVPGTWYKASFNVSTTDNGIYKVSIWSYTNRPPYDDVHFFQIDVSNSTQFFDGNFAIQYDIQVGLNDYQWAYYNSTWWLYNWSTDLYEIQTNDYPLINVLTSTPASVLNHSGGSMDIYYRFPNNLKKGNWAIDGQVFSEKWVNGTRTWNQKEFPQNTFISNYGGSIPTPPPTNNPYNIDIELWVKAVCLFMILILLFIMGYLVVKAGTEVASQ